MRKTIPTKMVLACLRLDEEIYGLQIIKATKLKGGTVYPILRRLEEHGLVESRVERPTPMNRPLRRYYWLTIRGFTRQLEWESD
jgi:PadR family transcriptional regulator PadR